MAKVALANPYRRLVDRIPIRWRLWWKANIAPWLGRQYYSKIIPETRYHWAWYLGAQPTENVLRNLLRHTSATQIHIISMLTKEETIIDSEKSPLLRSEQIVIHSCPWFDHSCINALTGKNQNIADFVKFQETLYKIFIKREDEPRKKIFYCHCMAGIARSLVETLAFLYFYPQKRELFDFENWTEQDFSVEEERNVLRGNPSFTDLAKFVKRQRSQVRNLIDLEGEQRGIIGLLALHKLVQEGLDNGYYPIGRGYLSSVAEIGYSLSVSLDLAFREEEDRQEQLTNLATIYMELRQHAIDLFTVMCSILPCTSKGRSTFNFSPGFRWYALREKIHLLILMQQLKQGNGAIPFSPTQLASAMQRLLVHWRRLTAGDLVEILRYFDKKTTAAIDYPTLVRKISHGSRLDSYNSKEQLAELTSVILHS